MLPGALETFGQAIASGDLKAAQNLIALIIPHQKATYAPYPIDADDPQKAAASIRAELKSGELSADQANALLDVVERLVRFDTTKILSSRTIDAAPDTATLDAATSLIEAALQTQDLHTLETGLSRALPYTAARPEPVPPAPTDRVESTPDPAYLELTDAEFDARHAAWEQQYAHLAGQSLPPELTARSNPDPTTGHR